MQTLKPSGYNSSTTSSLHAFHNYGKGGEQKYSGSKKEKY